MPASFKHFLLGLGGLGIALNRRWAASIFCAAMLLVTAGCGSGGSGSGPAGSLAAASRPPPDPLGEPFDPSGESEFEKNDGLDIINAEAAYGLGATGAGVTVALIDTGIDASHPDLANNVSAASFDVVAGSFDISDATGHGTKVAGVIAAERNGLGSHGVAFEATLLAVNTYSCTSACGFLYSDVAVAVNYATDALAHVINMSLAGTGSYAALEFAMQRAANAGVFVVVATGNSGASEPGYPANTASNGAFGNMVVAVGAVTDSGTIASFSNRCGSVMNNCLVAPGVGIATTKNGASSATSTTSVSGTSVSAPHVSGALALLVQLYPNAYTADPSSIMIFMLDGADDLGAAGVDSVYGHGLLDVDGAIQTAIAAITAAAVPLPSGGTASLVDSSLLLGPAFGDALAGNALLDRAIAVITLSDGDHPYMARLDDRVAAVARSFGLEALLAARDTRTYGLPIGDGMSLAMAVAGGPDRFAGSFAPGPDRPGGEVHAMQFSGSLGESTDVRLGFDVTAASQLDTGPIAAEAGTLFWSPGETMNPLPRLAGSGSGFSVDQALGGSTTLSLGLFDGEMADAFGGGGSGTMLGQAGLTRTFASGGALRLDIGVLDESAAFLGSQGAGAFTTDDGAVTHSLTLSGALPLGRRLELLGSVTMAATEMDATAGVLGEWSTVRSNAFAVGVVARDVLDDGDRLGLLVGQPLRVYAAHATVRVPVALTDTGEVVHASERVDLTPSGREIDLQLAYDLPLAEGMNLSSWLMMRLEPGHDADAGPAYGAGVTFRLRF